MSQDEINRREWLQVIAASGAALLIRDISLRVPFEINNDLLDQIRPFAPLIVLHPREKYWPMDPMNFIRRARLRHHRSGASDQGYNKARGRHGEWVTGDENSAEYYNIPVDVIDGLAAHGGKNRRPYDENAGSHLNVFLETDGNEDGHHDPTNHVPAFVHIHGRPSQHGRFYIQFFLFYGYNDSTLDANDSLLREGCLPFLPPVPLSFSHQGDWEYVVVEVRNGNLYSAGLSAHGGIHFYPRDTLQVQDNHPIIYAAKGTHAMYPTPGRYRACTDLADRGYQWETGQKLRLLAEQPWRHFAGAWGKVGAGVLGKGRSDTTGPLGPWFKRYPDVVQHRSPPPAETHGPGGHH